MSFFGQPSSRSMSHDDTTQLLQLTVCSATDCNFVFNEGLHASRFYEIGVDQMKLTKCFHNDLKDEFHKKSNQKPYIEGQTIQWPED
jgi:hypothetical protein